MMSQRVIDKITRFAPAFEDILIRHITFAPYHMQTMFAAPDGDFCHGLPHPDLMGPNRPGARGFLDSRFRSAASISAARAAMAGRELPSPPATTPPIRCSTTRRESSMRPQAPNVPVSWACATAAPAIVWAARGPAKPPGSS